MIDLQGELIVDQVRKELGGPSSTARLLGGLVPHVRKVPGRVQRDEGGSSLWTSGRLRS